MIHTGFGEWGLAEWYSATELKKLEKIPDGANARDKSMHASKMKTGIAAVKARGAHYGRAPKITEEMWDLAVRLCADEGKPIAEVYPEILKLIPEGQDPIAKTAFSNRKKQFMAREKYPDSWRAYFEGRRKVQEIKDSLDGEAAELRDIK